MGHLQDMTPEQRSKFIAYSYKNKLECNRGYNFKYFNQKEWDKLEANGYQMWLFGDKRSDYKSEATTSVIEAKELVEKLRGEGNYARIICGYI